jgi:hypothetical protein
MARCFMILGALLLVLVPSIGLPQAGLAPMPLYSAPPPPTPGWNNGGTFTFPVAPGSGWGGGRRLYEDELRTISVNASFGRQWMKWNAFYPFASNPDPELQVFEFERMDVSLKDGDFWVGFAGVELQPVPTLSLFCRYGANIPRLSAVEMDASGRATRPAVGNDPANFTGNGANTTSPWYWDTSFHWWMLEGGAAWWFMPEVAFEMGFRTEHVDYRLENPRNLTEAMDRTPPGRAITGDRICPPGNGQAIDDPLGKFYEPFIGLRGKGRKCCGCETMLCYRWRIVGSPLIWSNWRDPFLMDYTCQTGQEITQTTYTLDTSRGGFVEGDFEGIYPISRSFRGTFWVAGSWLEVYGTANLTSTVAGSTIMRASPGTADIEDSRLHKSYYALGLGLELSI